MPGQTYPSLYGAAFPPSHVASTNLNHRQQPPEHRPAESDPQQQITTAALHVHLLDEGTTADDIHPLSISGITELLLSATLTQVFLMGS